MKKIITFILIMFCLLMSGYSPLANQNSDSPLWEKYPDNSDKVFPDADTLYKSLDRNFYSEYENAKMNIREKVFYKDINKVYSRADRYGKNRESGDGFHPKRQVYVFLTVSEDGKYVKTLTVDAETKRPLSKSEPLLQP
ncbi:hypothetical protein [Cytobacillus horneckiae]|uniref:hypothetical protein n=1 Tax=Cytobacillus horneckiae TaxID=549687 RepID=UPI00203EB218|nr:hypothetical protein [Cytobacillus horneckiae]MCM3180201.1 hypothetical protein [Cytobacillus horneckiae]